jgi:hypothetical protein
VKISGRTAVRLGLKLDSTEEEEEEEVSGEETGGSKAGSSTQSPAETYELSDTTKKKIARENNIANSFGVFIL